MYFLLLLSLFILLPNEDAFQCDSSIVEKINKLWNGRASEGLLKSFESAGQCVVVAGTQVLLGDDDLYSCLRADFKNHAVQTVHHFINGTIYKSPTFAVTDVGGRDLYSAVGKRHRYYLPFKSQDGVAALYLCEEDGATGGVRGNIVVFSSKYSKAAVESLKNYMNSVGVPMKRSFPDTCPDKS